MPFTRSNRGLLALAACLLATAVVVAAQDPAPAGRPDTPSAAPTGRPPGGNPFGGVDLVKGLKEAPGCLGVETARTSTGKSVIFAWFESKQAVVDWYTSDTHQKAMFAVTNGPSGNDPLADVPDDNGPVLVVASLKPSEKPELKGVRMPISQIAIELYKPLPGGAMVGGRFAPESLKVPGMRDYTPKSAPK